MRLLLCAVLLIPASPAVPGRQGRYAPPPDVGCDRNDLTVHVGEVTRYARKDGRIRLTLKTDEDTVESVSLEPGDKILLDGQLMKEEDWKKVEAREGQLKRGMRAAIWICRGGRPVLDWRPPRG